MISHASSHITNECCHLWQYFGRTHLLGSRYQLYEKGSSMKNYARFLMAVVLGLALDIGATAQAIPLPAPTAIGPQASIGTGVTYQGRLTDGGKPANGAYDYRFTLFDAAVAGAQLGPIVSRDDVPVSAGLFNVTLDFGAVFDGKALYREIGMRPGQPQRQLHTAPSAPAAHSSAMRPGTAVSRYATIAWYYLSRWMASIWRCSTRVSTSRASSVLCGCDFLFRSRSERRALGERAMQESCARAGAGSTSDLGSAVALLVTMCDWCARRSAPRRPRWRSGRS